VLVPPSALRLGSRTVQQGFQKLGGLPLRFDQVADQALPFRFPVLVLPRPAELIGRLTSSQDRNMPTPTSSFRWFELFHLRSFLSPAIYADETRPPLWMVVGPKRPKERFAIKHLEVRCAS
jgi:hypothetical protein